MRSSRSARALSAAVVVVLLLGAALVAWRLRARGVPPAVHRTAYDAGTAASPRQDTRDRTPVVAITLTPTTADDAGAGLALLEGSVVSLADGTGIANATLTFARGGASATVTTDASGAFRFETSSFDRYELVLAMASGFAGFGAEAGHSPIVFVARPGARVSGVVVRLAPQVDVQGVVLDPQGQPVSGATVRAFAWWSYADAETTTTDAQGTFRLSAVARSVVEATHARYRPVRRPIRGADDDTPGARRVELRFTTERGDAGGPFEIAGRVIDPSGAPLGGVSVTANPDADDDSFILRATTSTDGTFVLTEATRGTYQLRAAARGFVPARLDGVAGGTRDVSLQVSSGATLTGSVRDGRGAPVPGFTIVAWPRRGPLARGAPRNWSVYDAAGRFEITGFSSESYFVTAIAHGYGPAPEASVDFSGGGERATANRDFTLTRGGRVSGVVLESGTRAPIAGAQVRIEGPLNGGDGDVAIRTPITTSADGSFALDGLAPGYRSITVTTTRHHGRIVSGLRVESDTQLAPLTIELTPVREGERPSTEMAGIGASLRADGNVFRVMGVMAGGGAAEVGLQPGDAVLRIEGERVEDLGFENGIERIRGPEGTTVRLLVQRGDAGANELTVPRRRVRY